MRVNFAGKVRRLGWCLSVWGIVVLSALGQTRSSLTPGPNVNMVSGTGWPGGDPFLQRQNEPSIAASSRNPLHLLAAANDYRSVDIPGILGEEENGDAWIGLFTSLNGGLTWTSTLLPGCPYNIPECEGAPAIKGLQAAADPLVRAGTNGLFYVSGIAFNRGENAPGAVFIATYIDNNNKENGNPIKLVRMNVVDTGTSGQFLDKPWLAVDIPRSGAKSVSIPQDAGGGSFRVGNVYFVYSRFVGSDVNNPHSQVMFMRSTDGGQTWENPIKLSETYSVNQGTTMAINPSTGDIYVAWRDIQNSKAHEPDAIVFCKSGNGGQSFTKASIIATINPFDQGSSALGFRARAFPTMVVDSNGVVYLAWSQRGLGPNGEAKIVMTTSSDSKTWTSPAAIEGASLPGHQIMPAAAYAGGKIMVTWYDSRDDHTFGVFTPAPTLGGQFIETREAACANCDSPSQVFGPSLSDAGLHRRHTIDLRVSQASPGASPRFEESTRVSRYKVGTAKNDPGGDTRVRQLQFNPPNLPMFMKGTVPFMGDYIDLTPAVQFVKDDKGNWQFNISESSTPVFHAVWTDNRDVRQPKDGNWANYIVPKSDFATSSGSSSLFDPTQSRQLCASTADAGQTGIRNQNIYTATIAQGLVVGTLGNAKPLLTPLGTKIQRGYVMFVQNKTDGKKDYTLNIQQPATAQASFLPDQVIQSIPVSIPARSTISRTVWISYPPAAATTNKYDSVTVTVNEPIGTLLSFVILNPDATNPEIVNPDSLNAANIQLQEVFNADISQADIINRNLVNADIVNADIVNADIVSADIVNADIVNADIVNADIVNADIVNADIVNADIVNADIVNASITDATWTVKNVGNTATSYSVKLLSGAALPRGAKLQLIISRTATTPISISGICGVKSQTQNLLVASIPDPTVFANPNDLQPKVTDVTVADAKNATLALAPGEIGKVTLRMVAASSADAQNFFRSVKAGVGTQTSPLALIITSLSPSDAIVDRPYGVVLQASGGTGGRHWSVITDATLSGLPAGLTLLENGSFAGSPKSAGSYQFKVKVADDGNPNQSIPSQKDIQVLTLNVAKGSASFVAGSLDLTATYDGQPKTVAAQTTPAGLTGVQIYYGGSTVAPTNSGTYAVRAHLDNPNYTASDAFGTLVIGKASATLTLGSLAQTYDGTGRSVTFSTTPAGLSGVSITYDGTATLPVNAGSYAVVASLTNSNYQADNATGTLVIGKASATLTLGSLAQTYDGTGRSVTFSTTPAGLSGVSITYDGTATLPVNAGSYAVVASLNNANYQGTASGTLVISPAGQTITFAAIPNKTFGMPPFDLSASASSGLTVIYSAAGDCNVAGSTVAITGAGSCTITASQGGNGNWAAAPSVPQTFAISKATTTTTIVSDLPDPSLPGQTVAVAWSIAVTPSTAGAPGGNVTVSDGTTSCAAEAIAGGCSLTFTTAGSRVLTATYAGDRNFTGSSGTAPHSVQPLFTFVGFLTPLTTAGTEDAPSNSGTFNYGQAIPIKWQLKDALGALVTDQASATILQAVPNSSCSGKGNGIPIPLSPSAAGATVLRYDAAVGQYVFNWDTTSQALGCYNIVVRLSDSTVKSTIIRLK